MKNFKITPLSIVLIAALGSTSAIKADKLSASLHMQLANASITKAPANYPIGLMLTVASDFDESALAEYGFDVTYRFGNIVGGRMLLSKVQELNNVEGIKKVNTPEQLMPTLDMARAAGGVDKLHEGIKSIGDDVIPYTGKGVLVGMVDGGINARHPAFRDIDGDYRVKCLNQTESAAESSTGAIVVNSYTKQEDILAAEPDLGAGGHGTHTTNIAAGSYKGNPYYGVAPEADLYLTTIGDVLYNDEILYGIGGALRYARKKKMPAVVSLSLGSPLGFHDGDNEVTELLQDYDMTGKFVVFAAGNDGDHALSLSRNFAEDSTPLATALAAGYSWDASTSSQVIVSALDGKSYDIAFTIIDMQDSKTEVWRSEPITEDDFSEIMGRGSYLFYGGAPSYSAFPEMLDYFDSGYLYVAPDREDNKYYQVVYFAQGTQDSNPPRYAVGIVITSDDGAEVTMVTSYPNTYFCDFGLTGYSKGNSDNSISDKSTSPYVVSVGAWNARDKWVDLDGATHDLYESYYGNYQDLANYSSYGPRLGSEEHVQLPVIVSPGTAVSSAIIAKDGSNTTAMLNYEDEDYYWGIASGTSMATPFTSGVIALWLQADPTLTLDRLLDIFEKTSTRDEYVKAKPYKSGYGKIDAYEGLKLILEESTIGKIDDENAPTGLMLRHLDSDLVEVVSPFNFAQAKVQLYNPAGALVKEFDTNDSQFTLSLSGLGRGVYILRLSNGSHTATQRLLH